MPKIKKEILQESKEAYAVDTVQQKRIKDLQWKKDAKVPSYKVQGFLVDVIYGKKWQADHLSGFPPEERSQYYTFLESALNSLAFDDRDRFINRIENVLTEPTKDNIWEAEHVTIENTIHRLTHENNRFPTRSEMSQHSGLSQSTVEKHIVEYFESSYYKKRKHDFIILRERLLSRCYKYAMNGDFKAARLFLEASANKKVDTVVNSHQSNFLQINNVIITQEQINKLPEDKRGQMREILDILTC